MFFTVFKLEPRFLSFLLAALVNLSYTDFIWFEFSDFNVYLMVGEEEALGVVGWRGEGHLTGHFQLVLWSSEFFLPLLGVIYKSHSCLLVFIESLYFVINVTFNVINVRSLFSVPSSSPVILLTALRRPQCPQRRRVEGTTQLPTPLHPSPTPFHQGACFFHLADLELLHRLCLEKKVLCDLSSLKLADLSQDQIDANIHLGMLTAFFLHCLSHAIYPPDPNLSDCLWYELLFQLIILLSSLCCGLTAQKDVKGSSPPLGISAAGRAGPPSPPLHLQGGCTTFSGIAMKLTALELQCQSLFSLRKGLPELRHLLSYFHSFSEVTASGFPMRSSSS